MKNRIVKYYDPIEGELWGNFDERLSKDKNKRNILFLSLTLPCQRKKISYIS